MGSGVIKRMGGGSESGFTPTKEGVGSLRYAELGWGAQQVLR